MVPTYLEFPAELVSPQALTDYALQHLELYDLTPADLARVQTLVREELNQFRRLIPEQKEKALTEVELSGEPFLSYVWNLVYTMHFLCDPNIESEFPCGVTEKYTKYEGVDPQSGFEKYTFHYQHLFQEPDGPNELSLSPEELQASGIHVQAPVILKRLRLNTGEATPRYFLVTAAVQTWIDAHTWFTDTLTEIGVQAMYFGTLSHFQIRLSRQSDRIAVACLDPRSQEKLREDTWVFFNFKKGLIYPLEKPVDLIVDIDHPALFMAGELPFQTNLRHLSFKRSH